MSAASIPMRRNAPETDAESPERAVQIQESGQLEALPFTDADANAVREGGMTRLMQAAANGCVDLVRNLLEHGADVNAKKADGFTALSLAAFFGHLQVVRLLLERGADIEAKDRVGTSAAMWAAARGFTEIVRLLDGAASQSCAPARRISELGAQSQQLSLEMEQLAGNLEAVHKARPLGRDFASTKSDKQNNVNNLYGPEAAAFETIDRQTHKASHWPKNFIPRRTGQLRITSEVSHARQFVTQVISSWSRLATVAVAGMLVCASAIFAVLKIAREPLSVRNATLPKDESQAATRPMTNLNDRAASEGRVVSAQIESKTVSKSEPVDSKPALIAEEVEKKPDVWNKLEPDRTWASSPTRGLGQDSNKLTKAEKSRNTTVSAGDSIDESSVNDSSSSSRSIVAISNSEASTTEKSAARDAEAEPKPAPLTVQVSHHRLSLSEGMSKGTPDESTALPEGSSQSKKKVIQWP